MMPESKTKNLENISKRVMTTYNNLDWLRSKLSFFDGSADFTTLHENLAALDSGMDEANLILNLFSCFSKLEAENQLLKLHIQKLEENNAWLSEELRSAQNKLQTSEQNVAQLKVKKKHLEFIAGLQDSRQADDGIKKDFNSTFNSDKLQDLEDKWNISKSSSDSGLDENYASDCGVSVGPSVHNTPFIKKVQTVSSNPSSINIDVDKLTRTLLASAEVCPKIRNLRHHVIQYATEGRIDHAALLCQLVLGKIANSIGQNDAVYVSALIVLATVHQFQGKHESSISLLKRALELREGLLSSTHLSMVDLHNRLGLILIEKRKFEDAEFHLRKALKIKTIHLGDHHEDVAKQLKNLAIMFRRQRKFEEAAHYYNSTARIYWDRYGPNDPLTTKAINDSVICSLKYQELIKKTIAAGQDKC